MPGFSQNLSTATSIPEEKKNNNVSANDKALAAFKSSLPDKEKQLEKLLTLQFFALCPNGKRIPVEKMCEEYAKDPTGLVLRSVEDRLVLVIQAMFPGEKTPYWQQAFYMSTGESSGMPKTWLPFNGVVLQGNPDLYSYGWKGEKTPIERDDKMVYVTPWFSKDDFCMPGNRAFPYFPDELEERKKEALKDLYSKFYLPEGNYNYYKSRFDRFGTPSFLLASHAIGGNEFDYKKGDSIFKHLFENKELAARYVETVDKPKLLQKCFEEMASSYPISKPTLVNEYIDKHHAVAYMNAFRSQGIFPPGLSFGNVLVKKFGYSLPLQRLYESMSSAVSAIWQNYTLGKISLKDVKKLLSDPKTHVEKIKTMLENCASGDKGFTFNIPDDYFDRKNKLKNYFGGRRKKSRKTTTQRKKQATRKH